MSVMRQGYGSEWHLRSMLATTPERVSHEILTALTSAGLSSARDLVWHQSYLTMEEPEICGLDFLDSSLLVRQEWSKWWPQRGNVQNWDAVGTLHLEGGETEWLLVEAKANLQEVCSNCGAKEHGGLPLIRSALRETQVAAGVAGEPDWTQPHYQYPNRLALLHFLHRQGVAARLVFLYFTGDKGNERRVCPRSREEWAGTLECMKRTLGLNGQSELEKHVHEVFLDVKTA